MGEIRFSCTIERLVERGHHRASDADRERIAERLRHAATEGRLAPDELDERLGTALRARTYSQLRGLVADLPSPRPARRLKGLRPVVVYAAAAVAIFTLVPSRSPRSRWRG